jgi:hypothetical protein
MDAQKAVSIAIKALLSSDAKRAVYYVSPKEVVSVCRRFKASKRATRDDFVLKIGAPNYLERFFVKACVKAEEPFPVKKVQLQPWPVKRKVK